MRISDCSSDVCSSDLFLMTITLMGLATAAIGFIPFEAAIGAAAPIIIIGLRLIQGLALGGEYGGAAIYVSEHAPKDRRGYFTSLIQARSDETRVGKEGVCTCRPRGSRYHSKKKK